MKANTAMRKVLKTAALIPDAVAKPKATSLVILLYHRVRYGWSEIDLPPPLFRSHLRCLAAERSILSLDEGLEKKAGVVLTFDDGYYDFYGTVVPLLIEYRLPAVLYLTTGGVTSSVSSDSGLLNWSALREIVSTGLVTIGSHTHNHANLASSSERAAYEELYRSKLMIEDRLDISCEHFAYPWGLASPAAEHIVRRLFKTAALYGWKTNLLTEIDRFRLGRMPILRSDGMFFFRRKATGGLTSEAVFYRALRRGPWRKAGLTLPAVDGAV